MDIKTNQEKVWLQQRTVQEIEKQKNFVRVLCHKLFPTTGGSVFVRLCEELSHKSLADQLIDWLTASVVLGHFELVTEDFMIRPKLMKAWQEVNHG